MVNGEVEAWRIGVVGEGTSNAKLAYQRPTLTVYGSVRELTGGNSGLVNDSVKTAPSGMASSDPALKENAVRIGTHPAGFGIYLFDYKAQFQAACGHGRQFGVMANEVECVIPDAVVVQENGYRAVNYSMLGITRH